MASGIVKWAIRSLADTHVGVNLKGTKGKPPILWGSPILAQGRIYIVVVAFQLFEVIVPHTLQVCNPQEANLLSGSLSVC